MVLSTEFSGTIWELNFGFNSISSYLKAYIFILSRLRLSWLDLISEIEWWLLSNVWTYEPTNKAWGALVDKDNVQQGESTIYNIFLTLLQPWV